MVIDSASLTPGLPLAATEWPMLMPGPKLVSVMPLGAQASSRVRTTESEPGSQPAEMTETVPVTLAALSSAQCSSQIWVWMSKLSTVLMPLAR